LAEKVSGPLLLALGQVPPGSEHDAGGMVERLLHIQYRDLHRGYFFVVPAGFLPALSVVLLWKQDGLARAVTATAAAQFAFFYFQRRVSLHYFAPAMVLPLVVYWRTAPAMVQPRILSAATALAGLVALFVSWPRHPGPHLAARAVGAGVEDRLGGYDESQPLAFRRARMLMKVLPRDDDRIVPDSSYGGSPLAWFYYAHRGTGPRRTGYVFAPTSAPAGALADSADGVGLYVSDSTVLAHDRALRPLVNIAGLYQLNKYTLFSGR
jgi:hypothetical protein